MLVVLHDVHGANESVSLAQARLPVGWTEMLLVDLLPTDVHRRYFAACVLVETHRPLEMAILVPNGRFAPFAIVGFWLNENLLLWQLVFHCIPERAIREKPHRRFLRNDG